MALFPWTLLKGKLEPQGQADRKKGCQPGKAALRPGRSGFVEIKLSEITNNPSNNGQEQGPAWGSGV